MPQFVVIVGATVPILRKREKFRPKEIADKFQYFFWTTTKKGSIDGKADWEGIKMKESLIVLTQGSPLNIGGHLVSHSDDA